MDTEARESSTPKRVYRPKVPVEDMQQQATPIHNNNMTRRGRQNQANDHPLPQSDKSHDRARPRRRHGAGKRAASSNTTDIDTELSNSPEIPASKLTFDEQSAPKSGNAQPQPSSNERGRGGRGGYRGRGGRGGPRGPRGAEGRSDVHYAGELRDHDSRDEEESPAMKSLQWRRGPRNPQPHSAPVTPAKNADQTPTQQKQAPRRGPNSERRNRGTPAYGKKNGRRARFNEHWINSRVALALRAGEVVEGAFRVNAHRRTEAYATVTGISVDLLVEDSAAQNRAFDGDTVVLQIYPEEKWKNVHQDSSVEPEIKGDEATNHNHDSESEDIETPAATPQKQSGAELAVAQLSDSLAKQLTFSSASTDPNETNEQRNAQGPLEFLTLKETLDILAKNNGERRPTARVVAISEALHRTKQFVGFLQATKKEQGPSASDKMAILVPFDKRQPKIFIPMNECPHDWIANHKNHVSTLYACEFRKWAYDMIYPIGRMVGPMGACGDLQAETVALLAENGIDDSGFPEAVLKGLPTSFQISQADLKARRDLRKECIFSIDPPTAKDLDDALSIVPVRDASGRVREFTVGVHIADVSHYVKENTALDKLAQTRSTSTYLIQRCIPMLPPILSEDLCSLNPGLDRFAFSVIWTLDPQGNIINQWIGRTIIRSCAKLSYDDAQIVIDNLTPSANPDDLKQVIAESSIEHLRTKARLEQDSIHDAATIAEKIMWLNLVARQMRARRFVDGALRLNRVKLKFGLDPVTQLPTGFAHYVNKSANELVEEYMLLANMSVAKFIYETFPKGALLRRHPTPHERKLNEFLKLANFLGFDVDASSGGALYQSLLKYPDDVRVLLEELATRSMQTAQYFSTSTVKNPTDTNHYALNVPLYTHFTSPIRRYPDVLVHRICTAALALESSPSQSSRKQQSTPGKNLIRPTELDRMAKHSNMRKTLARKAQEQSEHIYLCLWLRDHPFVDEHCNVLEVGERFVKFYSHKLGRAVRVFLGALEDKKVKTKWDADSRTVHLTFPTGSKISLAHLTPVTVKFTVPTNRFPLDIDASLVLDHGVIPLEGSNVSTL